MEYPKFAGSQARLIPTAALAAVMLLAGLMGYAYGGYFVGVWALGVFLLAGLVLVAALSGALRRFQLGWAGTALAFFTGYTGWTFLSLLWSPNRGDAWVGAGQTLLYLLVFAVAVILLARDASRRWVLVASVLGSTGVAALTLATLVPESKNLFENGRLIGTVGYFNGAAAFLLVPFWVAIYLGGSRRVNPMLRGLVLAGATLCLEIATLTQSRGALVAMAVSLPTFFVISGQRLRGLLALVPVAVALLVSFPNLNEVYLAFVNERSPAVALGGATSAAFVASVVVGAYGLVWGLIDRWWRPPAALVRVFGGAVLVALIVVSIIGMVSFQERVGSPTQWAAQKWETFKTDDTAGLEQSRYLSASGSGRYILWQVAWKDFASHPVLGIGTHNYEATYYQLRENSVGYARQPHMLPLEVLSERGIVGGMLFFGFFGTCLAAGLRQRFTRLNAEGKGMAGAIIAAVAYWFVHSCAEWFWQIPAVTLPAIVYLAMLATSWRSRSEAEPFEAEPPLRWPWRAGVAAGAILAIIAIAPLYVAHLYTEQSEATKNPWMALQAVERAQRYNPVDPRLPQREAELRARIGDWPRAVRAYERAISLNPEHYAPRALLAGFYEERGENDRALSQYRKAQDLNPLDPDLKKRVKQLEEKASS